MAHYYKRHGEHGEVTTSNLGQVVAALLKDLRTDPGDPDDEHGQVSIGNAHWSVSADVSGLITFDNIDLLEGEPSDLPEVLYLRDVPDDALLALWRAAVDEDLAALTSFPWVERDQLPPYVSDFYRR
ncbi:MAG: hypothetical protein J7598_09455 [Mitsuaria chitosanitabida]|uniref:hypothetical protein n=1 Tax=Roseateles chitosanitabidus TaxID=65048 RepID=UPI001B119C9D|nr:hypothetical protein [Roseateles chitosanitabidus]MBO9686827.1 hypothetical protein [Roseateles chitosanitabidus]